MKKLFTIVCFAVLCTLAASAQTAGPNPHRNTNQAQPPAAVKHSEKGMYLFNCTGCGKTLASGYNVIDSPTTVSCPGTTGTCLIQADQWFQGGVATGNGVAACLYVDGVAVNGCYWNGGSTGWPYAMYSVSQGSTVSFGSHTVQTVIYDAAGGTFVDYVNVHYRVYKP